MTSKLYATPAGATIIGPYCAPGATERERHAAIREWLKGIRGPSRACPPFGPVAAESTSWPVEAVRAWNKHYQALCGAITVE